MAHEGCEERVDVLRAAADDDRGMAAVRHVLGSEGRRHSPRDLKVVAALWRSTSLQPPMACRHRDLLALGCVPRGGPASGFMAHCNDEV